MKKYFLFSLLAITIFCGGVYFENKRLINEPDTMIAVLIASLSISNARYQSTLNLEYLSLIEEGQLERLKHNIAFNEKLLNEVKVDAESVCNEIICSEKHLQIIENAKND